MMKLTSALKNSITLDWQSLVPQFSVLQPMSMARRIGPLIQGICLDRSSGNESYLPTVYVHCLCKSFPVLSLSLGQPLLYGGSGVVERISAKFHKSRYMDACSRIIASSLLPVEGNWKLAQVIEAHDRYRSLGRSDSRYPIPLMEDAVSICAWLGEYEKGLSLVDRYCEEARSWSPDVLLRKGGVFAWENTLRGLAVSGEALRKTVTEQIEALKLTQLPVSHFHQG